ncbi:hypothetical protein GGD65_006419 [Bradyrhizobium sp. CIR18]|nr:hypothetical protein [Bradyrhizobium sp. CIR18]
MQDRLCRAHGSQQLFADTCQSCSMADSSGLLGRHVGCCGEVAARATSSLAVVSCFADNDTAKALRESKPLARRALLSGSCRFVQKAVFDADAQHRQTRPTHSEQGGHSQCLVARTACPRALVVSICRSSALLWLSAHRRYAPAEFRTRSSSRRVLRGSASLSGPLRMDRVLARPPRPRTRKRRDLTLSQSGRCSIYS